MQHYPWEKGSLWASLDVASLYTSMPYEVGLTAVQYFLTKSRDMNSKQSEFLLNCIKLCLRNNYLTFLEQFYLHLKGTAMGANFAPVYANLTMG